MGQSCIIISKRNISSVRSWHKKIKESSLATLPSRLLHFFCLLMSWCPVTKAVILPFSPCDYSTGTGSQGRAENELYKYQPSHSLFFTNWRQGPPPANIRTHFIYEILTLLQWSWTDPTISPRYACITYPKRPKKKKNTWTESRLLGPDIFSSIF